MGLGGGTPLQRNFFDFLNLLAYNTPIFQIVPRPLPRTSTPRTTATGIHYCSHYWEKFFTAYTLLPTTNPTLTQCFLAGSSRALNELNYLPQTDPTPNGFRLVAKPLGEIRG
jgi:hypothetical protein